MQTKTQMLHIRIAPELKEDTERILSLLGLTTTQAITMFFHQIVLQKGIPFSVEVPNAVTRKTLDATLRGEGLVAAKDAEDMFNKTGI